MMTIIRIAAESLIFLYLIDLSVHDIRYKRVENEALLLMSPLVLFRLTLDMISGSWMKILSLVLGCIFGFGLMLLVAMITHNGIGGGDIKLSGILGLLCGLDGVIILLLTASFAAVVYGLVAKLVTKGKVVRIPFVPFMTVGYIFPALIGILVL